MDYYGPMPSSKRLLTACSLALSLATGTVQAQSASPAPPAPVANTPVAEGGSTALDAELFYEIFLGELSLRAGDPGSGYALLLEAARRSQAEALYQRATDIALQSRSGEAALAAARAWEAAWPASHTAQRHLLQILLALNRTAETSVPLSRFLATADASDRQQLILSLPLSYRRASDKPLAAKVVTDALTPYYSDPALASAALASKGRMLLMAGNRADALAAAKEVATLAPASDEFALFALDLLEAKVEGAGQLVQAAFSIARSPQLRMSYARVLLELQRYALARSQVEAVTREHPEIGQPWLALATLQLHSGEVDAAEASLQQFTKVVGPAGATAEQVAARTQVLLLQSEIAEKRGKFDEAEAWLERIEDAETRFEVQIRRASLLARRGRLSHARALLQSLPEGSPEEKRRKLVAEVRLLRDNGQYAEAYVLQSELVQQSPDDADLLYDQAMLADKAGDQATMERLLRKLIATKPDFHHAYNALGYSFAERGVHLAEARKLVQTALRLAPGDPFITDSLAWVEFRAGNHARALELLASAFAMRKDAEIAAHYGEVLWVTGDREGARAIWREGMRTDAANATLLETLKRLGVSL